LRERERLWKDFKEYHAEVIRRGARSIIVIRKEPLIPVLGLCLYCPACRSPAFTLSPLLMDMEEIRVMLPVIIDSIYASLMRCDECGATRILVGYSLTSEAWAVEPPPEATPEEMEEFARSIDEVYRKYGSLKYHPRAVETLSTIIVTGIGKAASIRAKIKRDKKIEIGKDRIDEVSPEQAYGILVYRIHPIPTDVIDP